MSDDLTLDNDGNLTWRGTWLGRMQYVGDGMVWGEFTYRGRYFTTALWDDYMRPDEVMDRVEQMCRHEDERREREAA